MLEVADVIVIQKADLPRAEQLEAEVRATLALSSGPSVPVIRVSAKTGEGVETLRTAIAGQFLHRVNRVGESPELLRLAQDTLARWFRAAQVQQHPAMQQLLDKWQQGLLGDSGASEALLEFLHKEYGFRQKDPAG
jgi:putative protein kinase ArgK-like GTPase of G3E family